MDSGSCWRFLGIIYQFQGFPSLKVVDDSPCKTLVFPSELRALWNSVKRRTEVLPRILTEIYWFHQENNRSIHLGLSHRIHVWYIYSYIYHKNQPNVGIYIYTIHGSCGSTFPPKKFPKILALHSLWDVSCAGWPYSWLEVWAQESQQKTWRIITWLGFTWLIALVSFRPLKKRVVCTSKWPFNPWFIINRGEPNHLY